MEISLTFRHMDPSTELRSYVEEKVYKVKKYFQSPVEAHIILRIEKFRQIADITVSVDGNKIKAVDESDDMYSSVDQAMDKIEEQLRRLMSRKKEYRLENIKESDFLASDIDIQEGQPEFESKIIKTERLDIKPMDINEAAMQIDMSKKNFLVFTNAKSNNINIMYKRKDGNLGLIETYPKQVLSRKPE